MHVTAKSNGLIGTIRAGFRFPLFLVMMLLTLPLVIITRLLPYPIFMRLICFFYGIYLFTLGIRVKVYGEVTRHRPTLFVANHSSYMDIMVLGHVLPSSFVSKDDVRKWPVIGWLGMIVNTVFVSRTVQGTKRNLAMMKAHLERRWNLTFFPEGTTGLGDIVLPFKSSFFKLTEEEDLPDVRIQPVSIAYTTLGHHVIEGDERLQVSWISDMSLLPHIWLLMHYPYVKVEVRMQPPIDPKGKSRKELAAICEEKVRIGLQKSLSQERIGNDT